MRIAVIGGGITGLSASYELAKRKHRVTVYEKERFLGGLASGFARPGWKWPIEGAYHHIFTNDRDIITLSRELSIESDIMILRPVTSTMWNGKTFQLDSPKSLLTFPGIPPVDRVRTGIMIAGMKLNPFWQPLDSFTAKDVFRTLGGAKAWETIWEPLITGKFGTFADRISAAWFWARIKKRTTKLGYFRGGFHHFIRTLSDASGSLGTTILPKVTVGNIKPERTGFLVTADGNSTKYDAVLLTVPSAIAARIVPSLPQQYVNRLLSIPHLHAQIVILETKKPILEENIYWLNITDPTFPFLAVVGHTNLIDPSQYGGHHLTYLGNYLPEGHRYLTMRTESILDEYLPYVRKLNRSFRRTDVISVNSFIGPFAQPVHTIGYSHRAPETRTPIASLYLSNMDSIYPWDRGTNYAVRIGLDAARTIDSDRK